MLVTARMMLLIVSLGLTLAAAEVIFRIYLIKDREANSFKRWKELHAQGRKLPVRTMHPIGSIIAPCENKRLIYELQSNLDMEFAHRRLKTNSAGMRAFKEYPVERLPNSIRILGLGDSGMFGWDIEQDKNYMHMLEKNLNNRKDGITYEVLNFAVPGYNTIISIIPSATAKAIAAKMHFPAQRRFLKEWLISINITTALYLPETHLTSPDLIRANPNL